MREMLLRYGQPGTDPSLGIVMLEQLVRVTLTDTLQVRQLHAGSLLPSLPSSGRSGPSHVGHYGWFVGSAGGSPDRDVLECHHLSSTDLQVVVCDNSSRQLIERLSVEPTHVWVISRPKAAAGAEVRRLTVPRLPTVANPVEAKPHEGGLLQPASQAAIFFFCLFSPAPADLEEFLAGMRATDGVYVARASRASSFGAQTVAGHSLVIGWYAAACSYTGVRYSRWLPFGADPSSVKRATWSVSASCTCSAQLRLVRTHLTSSI